MHADIIRDMHGPHPRVLVEAFRGGAKSSLAEECMVLRSALREFKYGIVLGNTYSRAAQRLSGIKREIDNNPYIMAAFGDLRGAVWNEGKVLLSNGVIIEAFGARQSLRGAKEETRPDFVLIDDLEDDEWVKNPEAVKETSRWFASEFLPALQDPLRTPIRMLGTPLADMCLLRSLARSGEWLHRTYPIRYFDEGGRAVATWPEKHSLADVEKMEANYTAQGEHASFMQEYMLVAEAPSEKVFTADQFRYDAQRQRTWQAVYAMVDPARTTAKTSAMTGWAVWSWAAGGELVIWEMGGDFLQPDKIVDLLFRLSETYSPVEVGFERDGLEQWAMQPIREAMVKRGSIPLRGMKAPRDKLTFIRGLQAYFHAKLVLFAGSEAAFSTATAQLLSFPRGKIDAPNALAYANLMRPGEPIFGDFSPASVFEGQEMIRWQPTWLAMNADGSRVTAALAQDIGGVVRVLADWCVEGLPGDVVGDIMREAGRLTGGALKIVLPPMHFDKYRNVGLAAAIQRANGRPVIGAPLDRGRIECKAMLQRRIRGEPAFQVSSSARRVLNGMVGGYSRRVLPGNVLAPEASEGIYKTLLEGLESFCGTVAFAEGEDDMAHFKTTNDGRRYRSALK